MAYYIVSSGGTNVIGTDNQWNSMTIIDGGSVNGREIQSSGYIDVSSGGYANNIQICFNGSMYVFSGGKADNTAVKDYGSMFVYSGGIANKTIVYGWGTFNVSSGGIVNSTIVSGGSMYVSSGGIANETNVSSGSMYVYSGGIANSTFVSLGFLYVSSGATATNIVWTPGKGHVYVLDGGTATFSSQYSGVYYGAGEQFSQAMVMEDKTVVRSKEMNVMSGGTAINTTVNESGYLYVSSGGRANSTTVNFEGKMYVSSGGVAENTLLYGAPFTWNGAWGLFVSSGGSADRTVVSGGHLYVSSGGTATNIIWTPCEGHVNVSYGGYVTFASEYSGVYYGSGKHLLSNTSVLEDTLVSSYCDLYAMSGGVANRASVNISGNMYVCSGGIANSTTVNESGYLCISSGGIANYTVLSDDEHMIGGRVEVFNGGLANNTIVKANGSYGGLIVYSDGVVSHTQVYGHGKLSVLSGGITCDTNVYANGTLKLATGAIMTGKMNFTAGAIIFVEHGAVMDFNITQTSTEEKALLSAWSMIQGAPDYTITVNSDQKTGVYKLAGSADEFDATITVKDLNGKSLGTITVGESLSIGDKTYLLELEDESLVLSITGDTSPDPLIPEKPVVTADVTTLTNGDVHVTASFSEFSVLNEYSFDGQEWIIYEDAITVSENGFIFFRSTNKKGIASETAIFQVKNIDKTPPEKPVAAANVTTPTNMDVLVTATFSEDSVVKQYSFDSENWGTYPGGVLVGTNLTVYFRGIDAAGNASEAASYEVTNVDRSAPVITLTGDNQTPASEVLLTAETDDGSALYYCVDDSGWKEYTETITVTANGSYSFRATDAAGNTAISEILFANIKITAPVNLVGTADGVSWEYPAGADLYEVNLSTDDFRHAFRWLTDTTAQDLYELPGGTYQWRVMVFDDGEDWAVGEDFVSENDPGTAKVVRSNADGVDDIFFASANGTWSREYFAQHAGSLDEEGWTGTGEFVSANGKGRIQNLFFGSSDPSILCLTDGENGDAIFLDDVYTELPEELEANTARLLRIMEIRAGAGDDIIDMTSQRFEYVGDGQTLCGGDGNDTIWANKGANWLFGDAGDDRITGASGNDVIAGGIGDDRLHGGGSDDIFTFCDNWGTDTVKQLDTGTVTLWFASGSIDNWDEATLTYSDGTNSVKVSGVAAEQVTLKFGAGETPDDEDQFASLSNMGAFEDFTTRKIFEEATLA